MLFDPFPTLHGPKLVLRALQKKDAAAIFELQSDSNNRQYIQGPGPKDLGESQQFIFNIQKGIQEEKWMFWALSPAPQGELIGTICIWNWNRELNVAEIGFELHPNWQKKGYMQQALDLVIPFAFAPFQQMQLKKLEAYTHQENTKAIRLLERNGFHLQRRLPSENSVILERSPQE